MRAPPIVRDTSLKVFAIVLAVLLRLTVAGDETVERGLVVPLEFENLRGSVEMLGTPPESVAVRVRGSSGVLRRLETGDVAAVIDLGSERPGSRLFDMTADRIQAPLGVEVTQVTPSTVALTLEARGSPRLVPVIPAIEGEPAPGFVVGRVTVEPAFVEVVGAVSLLRQLVEAITEPLDVTNASVPIQETVTVGVADPNLRLETPRDARVTVEILRAPVDRRLDDVPVQVRNLAVGLTHTVVPPTVSVTVHGPPDVMLGLANNAVGAFVDLAGMGAGEYNLAVTVDSHRSFQVGQLDPVLVQVTLR